MNNFLLNVKIRAIIIFRHIAQSTAACLLSMTGGNLAVLTIQHWKIALLTGLGTGLISFLASFGYLLKFQSSRFGAACIALVGSTFSDYVNHAQLLEAITTGIAATLLSLMTSLTPIDKFIKYLEAKNK